MYGLSRPTALDSDSPFAIASHALHDTSTPLAPTLKVPQRRAPPTAPSPVQYQPPPGPHEWRQPPSQTHASSSGGYALKDGGRDAYMGAGNTAGPGYRPSPTPPPQQNQYYQPAPNQQPPRPPSQNNQYGQSHHMPTSQPNAQGSRAPPSNTPYPLSERPSTSSQVPQPPGSYPLSPHEAAAQPYRPSQPPNQVYPANHGSFSNQPQASHSSPQGYSQASTGHPAVPVYGGQANYAVSPAQMEYSNRGYQSTTPGAARVPAPLNQQPQQTVDPRRSASRDSASGQELWQMFSSMDIRRTGQLGSKEVQELLARDSRWHITPREDCVKMLMSIFDSDRSGYISFVEFEGLWAYIKDWHNIFLRFDRDHSGTIDRGELDQALQSFGYPLPRDLVRKLEKRFTPPRDTDGALPKGITFDRFLMACVTVKHFTEAFRKRDVRNEGRLTIDYNTFMEMVLEAPV